MKTYKVTFMPSGPYFFGNEKTFRYPGQSVGNFYGNLYFIRGEAVPSQTTILGALRYLALPPEMRTFGGAKTAKAAEFIGPESFDIDSGRVQEFGAIRSVSPVFITGKDGDYVPTPLDHMETDHGDEKRGVNPAYSPFQNYIPVETPDGERLYTPDFDAKEGLSLTWMEVGTGAVEHGMIGSEVRVGIDVKQKQDAYFKKEYRTLKTGYSFAVYVGIEETVFQPDVSSPETVFLGQGGVPFAVRFAEEENTLPERVGALLERTHVTTEFALAYCPGEYLTGAEVPQGLFSVVLTRDHRSFRTGSGGRISKGGILHKLIRAGSVFLFRKEEPGLLDAVTVQQKNAYTIGMNHVIYIGRK